MKKRENCRANLLDRAMTDIAYYLRSAVGDELYGRLDGKSYKKIISQAKQKYCEDLVNSAISYLKTVGFVKELRDQKGRLVSVIIDKYTVYVRNWELARRLFKIKVANLNQWAQGPAKPQRTSRALGPPAEGEDWSLEAQYKDYEQLAKELKGDSSREKRLIEEIIELALKMPVKDIVQKAYSYVYEKVEKIAKGEETSKRAQYLRLFHRLLTLMSPIVWDEKSGRFKLLSLDPKDSSGSTVLGHYIETFDEFLSNFRGLEYVSLDDVRDGLGEISYVAATDCAYATLGIPTALGSPPLLVLASAYARYRKPSARDSFQFFPYDPHADVLGAQEAPSGSLTHELLKEKILKSIDRSLGSLVDYAKGSAVWQKLQEYLGLEDPSRYVTMPPREVLEEEFNPESAERAIRLSLDYRYQAYLHGRILREALEGDLEGRRGQASAGHYVGQQVYPVHIFDGSVTPPDSSILDLAPGSTSHIRLPYMLMTFDELYYNFLRHLDEKAVRYPIITGAVKRLRREGVSSPSGINILSEYGTLVLLLALLSENRDYEELLIGHAPSLSSRLLASYVFSRLVELEYQTGGPGRREITAVVFMPLPRHLLGRSQLHLRFLESIEEPPDVARYLGALQRGDIERFSDSFTNYMLNKYFGGDAKLMADVVGWLNSFKWLDVYVLPLDVTIPAISPRYEVLLSYRSVDILDRYYDGNANLLKYRISYVLGNRDHLTEYANIKVKRTGVLEGLMIDDLRMYAPEELDAVDERVGEVKSELEEQFTHG